MEDTPGRDAAHDETEHAGAPPDEEAPAPALAPEPPTDERDERMSALERERDAWQRERQELLARHEVEREARRMGLVDEEAAWLLVDQGAIEYDEEGRPTNVGALLEALVGRWSWLQPEGKIGPAPGVDSGGRDARLSPDAMRRMTPEEINADWARVQQSLRQPPPGSR